MKAVRSNRAAFFLKKPPRYHNEAALTKINKLKLENEERKQKVLEWGKPLISF